MVKKREIKDSGASIRARLTNIAKETKRDFDALLLQYFQERFLYRLSISSFRSAFILKGALLFLIYEMPFLRPTKDVDFLVRSKSRDLTTIKGMIHDIAKIEVADGVTFAEKFQSLVKLNILTSRMKDIYDILFLASHQAFDMHLLHKAIVKTFNRRGTPIEDRKSIFKKEFKSSKEKQTQWTAFLRRSHLESYTTFTKAIDHLELFLEPVCSREFTFVRRPDNLECSKVEMAIGKKAVNTSHFTLGCSMHFALCGRLVSFGHESRFTVLMGQIPEQLKGEGG